MQATRPGGRVCASAQRVVARPKGSGAETGVTAIVAGPVSVWLSPSGKSMASVSGKRKRRATASQVAPGQSESWVQVLPELGPTTHSLRTVRLLPEETG